MTEKKERERRSLTWRLGKGCEEKEEDKRRFIRKFVQKLRKK